MVRTITISGAPRDIGLSEILRIARLPASPIVISWDRNMEGTIGITVEVPDDELNIEEADGI